MTELTRLVRTDRIPDGGLTTTVTATPEECAAVAARLLLPAIARLTCRWDLRRGSRGAVDAGGVLQADVTQVCVVTLEPFAAAVADLFSLRFVIAGRESPAADDPDEVPYDGISLDLGDAAVEQLALALDPYPRKPGAELQADLAPAPDGAFAPLAKLRRPD